MCIRDRGNTFGFIKHTVTWGNAGRQIFCKRAANSHLPVDTPPRTCRRSHDSYTRCDVSYYGSIQRFQNDRLSGTHRFVSPAPGKNFTWSANWWAFPWSYWYCNPFALRPYLFDLLLRGRKWFVSQVDIENDGHVTSGFRAQSLISARFWNLSPLFRITLSQAKLAAVLEYRIAFVRINDLRTRMSLLV